MSQASYNAIVASSKLMAIAGVVILGVGWFMVPSCEEKIRKMEERKAKLSLKYDQPLENAETHVQHPSSQLSLNSKIIDQSKNKTKDSINVFKDL
ncbi:hypothetical protein BLOT_005185 [Blomia tropicalis]|nr:hypothetical protein BLOT_005185 [Blomia tropicalis]